jgi:Protein of unknown function (DUF3551)
MRLLALAMFAIAAVTIFGGVVAEARDYPFCRKGEGGPGDCKYDTYEQCLAAVSGTSGECQPNYWLSQPDPALSGRRLPRGRRLYAPGY